MKRSQRAHSDIDATTDGRAESGTGADRVIAPALAVHGGQFPPGAWGIQPGGQGPTIYAVPDGSAPSYWDRPIRARELVAINAKYQLLLTLTNGHDEPATAEMLRRCASMWPGSLREAELVSPAEIRERSRCVGRALANPDGRAHGELRSHWWRRGEAAAVLWHDLHQLLRAQLDYRAAGGCSNSLAEFVAFARAQGCSCPQAEVLALFAGPKLRVRQMYLWLAAWSGLRLPALNEILLQRKGHWDARTDDPAWTCWTS